MTGSPLTGSPITDSHATGSDDTDSASAASGSAEEVPTALSRLAARAPWRRLPHPLRWLTVALIGGTFVLVGIALLVLPGPGIAFIILGLAILATEFVWAEALLHRVKAGSHKAWRAAKARIKPAKVEPNSPVGPLPQPD